MASKTAPQQNQSVIGLFRAVKADPDAVPRTRPFYRRLVELVERADRARAICRPASSCRRSATGAGAARQPRDGRRARIASSRRAGSCARYVGRGTFVCARPDPGSAPFSWRGKVSAAALQSDDTTVRDLVAHAADPALMSFAAGTPALECFPIDAFRARSTPS